MNITELKELAEKATPGTWAAKKTSGAGLSVHADISKALGHRYSHDCPIYHFGSDSCTMAIAYELWTQFPRAEWEAMQEANANYVAAANPAAILELIANLEDAQGEIRALRATEAGLRERVKELESVLSQAREALAGGLWDYGPGQDEHEKCNEVIAVVDAALLEKKE